MLQQGDVVKDLYRITKELGQGESGAVYRAWDLKLGGPCALKEISVFPAEAQEWFTRQMAVLTRLSHPNLARVRDFFTISGQGLYMVMDFVEGEDLRSMLARFGAPLSEVTVLPWIGQVCDGLSYLHAQDPQIIHGDIKPANIRITSGGQAVLVDWGNSSLFGLDVESAVSGKANLEGSGAPYVFGKVSTDPRSDIHDLGTTLYTVLTGEEPAGKPQRTLGAELPSPRSLIPGISISTDFCILKAMDLSRPQRFQTAAEFKTALLSAAQENAIPEQSTESKLAQPGGEPTTMNNPNPKSNRRTLIILLIVVLIVLCCCCLATLYLAWTYGDTIMQKLGLTSAIFNHPLVSNFLSF